MTTIDDTTVDKPRTARLRTTVRGYDSVRGYEQSPRDYLPELSDSRNPYSLTRTKLRRPAALSSSSCCHRAVAKVHRAGVPHDSPLRSQLPKHIHSPSHSICYLYCPCTSRCPSSSSRVDPSAAMSDDEGGGGMDDAGVLEDNVEEHDMDNEDELQQVDLHSLTHSLASTHNTAAPLLLLARCS